VVLEPLIKAQMAATPHLLRTQKGHQVAVAALAPLALMLQQTSLGTAVTVSVLQLAVLQQIVAAAVAVALTAEQQVQVELVAVVMAILPETVKMVRLAPAAAAVVQATVREALAAPAS
jgi:hypothetical protein